MQDEHPQFTQHNLMLHADRPTHMLSGTGRPRRACDTCKAQKIRCSGERPSCTRCSRLRRHCVYRQTEQNNLQRLPVPTSAKSDKEHSRVPLRSQDHAISTVLPSLRQPAEESYHGIPKSLVLALVEVYYENLYNATLLLHKRLFLESLAAGIAPPHVVLSVCASAANFYRDVNGLATWKDHGFMTEWAQRAGSLVFQEAESLCEDNIVTHINLSLFWHSQGNWRICYLHKGAACNILHILGPGCEIRQSQDPWASELRRRRFWACYQAHCHSSDCLIRFAPASDLDNLALPWPEEDFEAGNSIHPRVTMKSEQSNGGLFPEIIKIFSLWSSVLSYVKSSDPDLAVRVPAIHALDQKLSKWWQNLTPDLKLTPSNITSIPKDALAKVLLLNIAYHQSLCALHSSIVPIFCWGEGDEDWLSARQLSAQCAYEHACIASELIQAVLSRYDRLSAMPSFISYAAYSGCAIQIPFLWSSNPAVREKAVVNVRANVQMIHTIADYWKFAALLKIYVRCLHNGHKKHPIVLENEPKFIDPRKLTSFKVNAPRTQASILEFSSLLYGKDGGYVNRGEEAELEVEPGNDASAEQLRESTVPRQEERSSAQNPLLPANFSADPHVRIPSSSSAQEPYQEQQPQPQYTLHMLSGLASNASDPSATVESHNQNQNLDIFHPLLDPEMLELFPNGELPDPSIWETGTLNLDYLDTTDWDSTAGSAGGTEGKDHPHDGMEWDSVRL